jgi:hypothetical protein
LGYYFDPEDGSRIFLHGFTSRITVLFVIIALRTSKLKQILLIGIVRGGVQLGPLDTAPRMIMMMEKLLE